MGAVSASEDTPLCEFDGCDQHAVPGSVFCGDEEHSHLEDPEGDDAQEGAVNPLNETAGYQDGTGFRSTFKNRRGRRVRPELRVVGEKAGVVTVEGLAIRYDVPYEVHDRYGTFIETMAGGAARSVLGDDCRFLFNHDGLALARTKSNTLALHDTTAGLAIRASLDVANSVLASDLAAAIDRGDIDQMSVGFLVDQSGDHWNESMTRRTITRLATLLDVSAVTFPASPTTTISVVRTNAERTRARLDARSLRVRVAARGLELSEIERNHR